MRNLVRFFGQAAVWVLFIAGIGYLSAAPPYRHFEEGDALLKLSFVHGGDHQVACRKRTREELLKLAPNMRKQIDCPRRRVDLHLEIDLDGKRLFNAVLPPTGLSGDGPSQIYRRFAVPAGPHVLDLRLRDTRRTEGFDHVGRAKLVLKAGQSAAIDFRPRLGGIVVR